ncbi:MAG: nucleotidyltransferase family protein, partial [Clostridia bacterium]|nr:nucleotidyltransferase family protein [Clostridia bacterium]
KKEPAMQKLFKLYISGMLKSEKQMEAIGKIYAAFDENGIDYLPLKGCNMKYLYPKPELRAMGDADILIRQSQYKQIANIMNELGYNFDAECEHVFLWNNQQLEVELHKTLIPISEGKIYEIFSDVWDRCETTEQHRKSMSAEDNFLHIFVHFSKHYRGGGIGVKHFTDIYVYKKANPNLDEQYIETSLKKIGLYEFYKNICDTIKFVFENGTLTEKGEFIIKTILNNKTYGAEENYSLWLNIANKKEKDSLKTSKFKRVLRLIFPSYLTMCQKYAFLSKIPVLLPFMYVVRALDNMLFHWEKISRQKQILERDSIERTENYIKALEYVGFDLTEV